MKRLLNGHIQKASTKQFLQLIDFLNALFNAKAFKRNIFWVIVFMGLPQKRNCAVDANN